MNESLQDLIKYEKIVESNYFIPHEVDEKDKKKSYLNFGNLIPPKKNKEKENDKKKYTKEEEKNSNGTINKTPSKEKDKQSENIDKAHSKETDNHKENLNLEISKESENRKHGMAKDNYLKNSGFVLTETDIVDNQIKNDKKQALKDGTDKPIESNEKDNLKETKDKQTITDSDNIPNEVKFGQHKSESFYENYGREIIFQIFGYPKMYHFSYDYEVKKNTVIEKITNWGKEFEKEDINLQSYFNKEKGIKNQEEDKNKKSNKENNINSFFVNSDDIKDSISFNTDVKTSGNESSDYDKNTKQKNLTDNEIKKKIKKKKKNNNTIKFKGDFDFLIHGLDGKILKEVLEDKKKYPFIFYGNIELKENVKFDILGEIKETLHKNQSEQALKYIKMIYHILKEDHTNEFGQKLGFIKENTKVLMYVFNSEYYSFLLEMLSFDINLKKFKNNEEEKSESFIKICKTFKGKTEKNNLIKTIIRSDLPFIFIFIPNILKIQYIKEKEKSELSEKVIILEEQLKKQNQEINDLNSKFDMKQKEFDMKQKESEKIIDDLKLQFENLKKDFQKSLK